MGKSDQPVQSFELKFIFNSGLPSNAVNQFWDRFLDEAIESNGLQFGGGGFPEVIGTIEPEHPPYIEYKKRKMVVDWLEAQTEVVSVSAGDIIIDK